MLQGIRQSAVVGDKGSITILTPELPVGARVEVIVLLESEPEDDTAYLLADQENRSHLLRALRDLEDPRKYTYVDVADL